MSAEVNPLRADGQRVWVRTVDSADVSGYRIAVEQSRTRLERWNPADSGELGAQLGAQGPDRRTFVIHARAVDGRHDIVGRVNVVNVVRGRLQSASMGYDAYDPYAGRGLFAEGLGLVVSLVLSDAMGLPRGMGLHRVEASVQPGNIRSAAVLRSLGFRQEGRSPRMLWLPDASGRECWRDHLRFAVTREEWPARPYAARAVPKVVVLVNGVPGSSAQPLATELATELGVPLLGGELPDDALWPLLRHCPGGAVLLRGYDLDDAGAVRAGLASAGCDPSAVIEITCSAAGAEPPPLGLGVHHRVDLMGPLARRDVVRLALEVGAASH